MSRTNSENISSLKLAFWTSEKGAPFRNRTNNAEMFYTQRFPTINCLIRRNNLCITMVNHRPLSVCDDGPQWILWLWALYWILICIWNEKLPQLKEYLSCYHCLYCWSLRLHTIPPTWYGISSFLWFFFYWKWRDSLWLFSEKFYGKSTLHAHCTRLAIVQCRMENNEQN